MMKKIVLLFLLGFVSFSMQAQEDINLVKEVNFYGVDFSKVKIFGAKEAPIELKEGISQINGLFKTEARKYDIGKYMGKKVLAYSFNSVDKNNDEMDENLLLSDQEDNQLKERDIQNIIKTLSYKDNNKTGLIFIAENLSKKAEMATYQVVFFDEVSKKIIYSKRVSGKSGGFSIRNFWASSIVKILKDWKY